MNLESNLESCPKCDRVTTIADVQKLVSPTGCITYYVECPCRFTGLGTSIMKGAAESEHQAAIQRAGVYWGNTARSSKIAIAAKTNHQWSF